MTTRRLTLRRTKLEKAAPAVIAAILDGHTDAEIARQFKVSREAVSKFGERHADEIASQREELAARLRDEHLSTKAGRIRELVWLYDESRKEAEDYGLTVVETRTETDDDTETVIVTRDFRAAMVKEMRGLLGDIAAELGERNKADVNIDARQQTLIVVQDGRSRSPS